MQRRHGFTLIELSIVLVIIGLIVGGILVGQDLIKAAAVRGQVSQLEKYMTSFNTFRVKYGYLPGDLPSSRATQLGFFAETTLGGTVGHQDGNGLIGGTGGEIIDTGEGLIVWRHLTDAQMIDGNYGTAASGNPLDAATGSTTNNMVVGTMKQVYPPAKLGTGHIAMSSYFSGRNAFTIARPVTFTAGTGIVSMGGGALSAMEAYNLDIKMDDGFARTGKIVEIDDIGQNNCLSGSQYNITSSVANNPSNCWIFLGL